MRPSRVAGLLACALLLSACGPTLVREVVFTSESGDVVVQLRRTVDGDQTVARGFAHPGVISDVRMAHILARLSYQDEEGVQQAVLRSEHVYDLASGLVKAFARAGPDDEVVARALSIDRRFGIFTVEKVTSFRAHFEPDILVLELFGIDVQLEKSTRSYEEAAYQEPAELPEGPLEVRLMPGEAVAVRGGRSFRVSWRDPMFGRPISLSVRGGKLRRRTILLEAEPEEEAPEREGGLDVPPDVQKAQLEALDRLDADRRAGALTEEEFQRRRKLILEGRLEEAGYGSTP